MPGRVEIERDGAIGWIVFDHVERRNAITVEMWEAIPEVAAELDAADDVRVIVMRGAGDLAFVSGADFRNSNGSGMRRTRSHTMR